MPFNRKNNIRHCIRAFSPAWFTIIMGTGTVTVLIARFHFGAGTMPLKVISLGFYFLNLFLFSAFAFITALRFWMFPNLLKQTLLNPAECLFFGAFPIGAASLIDGSIIVHNSWSFGRMGFLYSLWGFWWLDLGISFLTAFGLLYAMMYTSDHLLSETTSVWVLPIIPLIVLSGTGGNISHVLLEHSTVLASITTGFSLCSFVIGMSLTLMIITLFLTRLILHGPPKAQITPAGFIIASPLGQGGYSLLVNGEMLSKIFPCYDDNCTPPYNGQVLYTICLSGTWVLWSMGIAWIVISVLEILVTMQSGRIPFTLAYWGLVFPNGVFALCSVQLGIVLDSRFFHFFGAIWSVFALWLLCFLPTVIHTWDRSIFQGITTPPTPDPKFDMLIQRSSREQT